MALSKLAVKRLTKLAEYMDSLPQKARRHFAMDMWVQHAGQETQVIGSHGLKDASDISTPVLFECGMKACALGWGCSIPAFRRAGLHWETSFDAWNGKATPVPAYKDVESMEAAQLFFDLSRDATDYLFRDVDATTPKQWAKHCRKFIRDNAA